MSYLKYLPYTLTLDPHKKEVLDIRLGNTCQLACRGCCGSKCNTANVLPDTADIIWLADRLDTKLIMIDEVGEPTEANNRGTFKAILAFAKERGILVSCFSNMVDWDDELFWYVGCGTLCVLYQLYSENYATLCSYHQVDKVAEIRENINRLKTRVRIAAGGATNIAASMYPTTENIHEIPTMFNSCLYHGIYPFVGEYLRMGRGDENGDQLEVSNDELAELHATVSKIIGEDYEIPLCPCILNGVHMVENGTIIVDENTGFACDGLSYEDSTLHVIGKIGDPGLVDAGALLRRIHEYEQARLPYIRELRDKMPDYYFGSCSGRPKKILDAWLGRFST